MIARLLDGLRGDASLVAELGEAVLEDLAIIELLTDFLEVVFDHVNVGLVSLRVNARVSHEQDTELVERGGHLGALMLPALALLKVGFDIDDWGLFEFVAKVLNLLFGDFGRSLVFHLCQMM